MFLSFLDLITIHVQWCKFQKSAGSVEAAFLTSWRVVISEEFDLGMGKISKEAVRRVKFKYKMSALTSLHTMVINEVKVKVPDTCSDLE